MLAKHLFEHRYDYRKEWLRFTDTLGRAGPDARAARGADGQGPRRHRRRAGRAAAGLRRRHRPGCRRRRGTGRRPARRATARRVRSNSGAQSKAAARILDFEALRDGWASARDKSAAGAAWLLDDRRCGPAFPLSTASGSSGSSCSLRPTFAGRSTGRISTCFAPPASRPRASSPRRAASRRSPTRSASTSSTAASPSSCTTSRIWSAS